MPKAKVDEAPTIPEKSVSSIYRVFDGRKNLVAQVTSVEEAAETAGRFDGTYSELK